MEKTNLNGKTMIPFCTSGGTGIKASENTLKSSKELIGFQERDWKHLKVKLSIG